MEGRRKDEVRDGRKEAASRRRKEGRGEEGRKMGR